MRHGIKMTARQLQAAVRWTRDSDGADEIAVVMVGKLLLAQHGGHRAAFSVGGHPLTTVPSLDTTSLDPTAGSVHYLGGEVRTALKLIVAHYWAEAERAFRRELGRSRHVFRHIRNVSQYLDFYPPRSCRGPAITSLAALRAARRWASSSDDVELAMDDTMLVVEQTAKRTAFDPEGLLGSMEYRRCAPLDPTGHDRWPRPGYIASLKAVIDHSWERAQADFVEWGEPDNHIFPRLARVRRWLEEAAV